MITAVSSAVFKVARMCSTSSASITPKNRLSLEKSPYLLQHQTNPIHWFAWGDEAINHAKSLNRPIFLSVGYSTCHWCHVMEHESFENEAIAKILNDKFVSIKVDREERPDVDKLYMTFVQATTGSGGWPMSVFLTPNLEPFFGGTYFPPSNFERLLGIVAEKWVEDSELLTQQGKLVINALSGPKEKPESHSSLNSDSVVDHLLRDKIKGYDKRYGGFGIAPKFPKAVDLDFLLHVCSWKQGSELDIAKTMLRHTLQAMAMGGIHDHVGKGFHRYAVDEEWHVPHFEKMLYDQAQLLAIYSDYSRMNDGEMADVARDIADYMLKDLYHPEGGFFSAEDADSLPTASSPKKREGAFCVWSYEELSSVLSVVPPIAGHDALDAFCQMYDVHEQGNVNMPMLDPHGELTNLNVLRQIIKDEDLAAKLDVPLAELKDGMQRCKDLLSDQRAARPRPHLDSKMVAAWQGLAISGLAKASIALSDPALQEVAEKCVKFIRKNLLENDTSLRRAVYRADDGTIAHSNKSFAFSSDYAFVIQGLLDLFEVNGDASLLELAKKLQSSMDQLYWDTEGDSGYFISTAGDSTIAVRIQEDQDGAEPCTNSTALLNIIRLAEICEPDLKAHAKKIIEAVTQRLEKYPHIFPKMVIGLHRFNKGAQRIVLVGDPKHPTMNEFKEMALKSSFRPDRIVIQLNPDDPKLLGEVEEFKPMLTLKEPMAFVCEGFTCGLPIKGIRSFKEKLS